jgi:hypothetical protein
LERGQRRVLATRDLERDVHVCRGQRPLGSHAGQAPNRQHPFHPSWRHDAARAACHPTLDCVDRLLERCHPGESGGAPREPAGHLGAKDVTGHVGVDLSELRDAGAGAQSTNRARKTAKNGGSSAHSLAGLARWAIALAIRPAVVADRDPGADRPRPWSRR